MTRTIEDIDEDLAKLSDRPHWSEVNELLDERLELRRQEAMEQLEREFIQTQQSAVELAKLWGQASGGDIIDAT